VASLPPGKICQVFDVYQQFGQDNYTARDLDTSNGLSIWQNRDPVHLTDTAYMEIGMWLLQDDDNDEVFQLAKKRQRLETVVPAMLAKPASSAKAPPPMASWLTGRLTKP